MNKEEMFQILRDTDYVHKSGSAEERRCAEYLLDRCRFLGAQARLEEFPVKAYDTRSAVLRINGEEIECRAYDGFDESVDLDAPLYHLMGKDPLSLERCKDRIVLADGYPYNFEYEDIVKAGALAIIAYTGDAFAPDKPLDIRPIFYNLEGDCPAIPCALIRTRDAQKLYLNGYGQAQLKIERSVREVLSQNVVAELPGLTDEYVILSAHYDTTPLSHGSYDNMTGCITLLNAMEELKKKEPGRYGVKVVMCGCEETGEFGSKAYCSAHKDELEKCVLNINVDMLGGVGAFQAVCSSEQKLADFIEYWCLIRGIGAEAVLDAYSGDASVFADHGVPAVTFTRFTMYNTHISPFHTENDTTAVLSKDLVEADVTAVTDFMVMMVLSARIPVAREIPEKVKEALEVHHGRKREKKQQ